MNPISLGMPLAQGRTADVYVWDETHILKLFQPWFAFENIQYEQRIAQAVTASGVRAPAVGEMTQVDGRNGLIYERVPGVSMEAMFLRKPWKLFIYARILAQLHSQMHERSFDSAMPAQKSRILRKISEADALPQALKNNLSDALNSLPEGNRVCHGDFHPANVLLSEEEATVIDWIDATRGNPLSDVARTSIIALGAAETTQPRWIKRVVKLFHESYLKHYFTLRPGGENEYQRWLPIVAGARLSENIHELEAWLLTQAAKIT